MQDIIFVCDQKQNIIRIKAKKLKTKRKLSKAFKSHYSHHHRDDKDNRFADLLSRGNQLNRSGLVVTFFYLN